MDDCLERGLFTLEAMTARLAEPDMAERLGAALVGELIRGRLE